MNDNTTLEVDASVQNGIWRLAFAMLAMMLQLGFVYFINAYFDETADWFAIGTRIIGGLLVLVIYNQHKPAAMKMTWIIVIMAFPVFGIMFYLLIGFSNSTHQMRARYEVIDEELLPLLGDGQEALDRLDAQDRRAANIARYLRTSAGYPIYDDTSIRYFSDAADGLEAQKAELRQAQKFIFMEYHAIEDAEAWRGIQEVLEERAKAGIDVRVIYDDMGSIKFINTDFIGRLADVGIKAKVFNPFSPGLNFFLNNRDHRKITVVDGRVGFTGGYNLANEYFNITHPYGHWKDTGVRIEGNAVQNLTATFLEMWNAVSSADQNDVDCAQYLPQQPAATDAEGYVLPYADSPMDDRLVGEDVYISVAEYAQDFAWYVTPYLIISDEMTHALGIAAERGVDVRVITPGIPDKKIVYAMTRSYYHSLVRKGVRIYEYTPGFCHCKMSVADDVLATCGTINLDYRSLYHHFENGCLYYGNAAVADTKKDFEWMMAQAREVTDEYRNPRAGNRLAMLMLRLLSPLM